MKVNAYRKVTIYNYKKFFKDVKIGDVCTFDFYSFLFSDIKMQALKNGVKIDYITRENYPELRKELGDAAFIITAIRGQEDPNLEQNKKQEFLFDPEELVI